MQRTLTASLERAGDVNLKTGEFPMVLATDGEASDGHVLSIEGAQFEKWAPLQMSHMNDPTATLGSIRGFRRDLQCKPKKLRAVGMIETGGEGPLAEIRRDVLHMMAQGHVRGISVRWTPVETVSRSALPKDHPAWVAENDPDMRKRYGSYYKRWRVDEGSVVAIQSDKQAMVGRAAETEGAVSEFWTHMAEESERAESRPNPANYKTEEEFVSACIPMVMKEGKTQKQAAGQCYGMWEQHTEKHADEEGLERAHAVQTVIFRKDKSPSGTNGGKGWTKSTASSWLSSHDMKAGSPVENDTQLRYRQFEPSQCSGGYMTLTNNMPAGISMVACNKRDQEGGKERVVLTIDTDESQESFEKLARVAEEVADSVESDESDESSDARETTEALRPPNPSPEALEAALASYLRELRVQGLEFDRIETVVEESRPDPEHDYPEAAREALASMRNDLEAARLRIAALEEGRETSGAPPVPVIDSFDVFQDRLNKRLQRANDNVLAALTAWVASRRGQVTEGMSLQQSLEAETERLMSEVREAQTRSTNPAANYEPILRALENKLEGERERFEALFSALQEKLAAERVRTEEAAYQLLQED